MKNKKPKRIVLGIGYPWFTQEVRWSDGRRGYHAVRLLEMVDGDGLPKFISTGNIGQHTKIRLVAEIIE